MIVSMLDETSYVVGEKIYKVGDEIDLLQVPPIHIRGVPVPVHDLNIELVSLAGHIRSLRQTICSHLHRSDEHYNEAITSDATAYENAQRDWLYSMDLMFKAIQAHLGAPVPLHRDSKTGKITIRKRDTNESMNYTREAISGLVRFNVYTPLRELLMKAVGRGEMDIASNMHLETEMPCILVKKIDFATGALGAVDLMCKALNEGIASLNFGLPAMLMWQAEDATYFFDTRSAVPRGQGPVNELATLGAGIMRVSKQMPAPSIIGVLVPTRDKDSTGVTISAMTKNEARHATYKFAAPDKLERTDEGEGANLHPHIETLIKNALSKE